MALCTATIALLLVAFTLQAISYLIRGKPLFKDYGNGEDHFPVRLD